MCVCACIFLNQYSVISVCMVASFFHIITHFSTCSVHWVTSFCMHIEQYSQHNETEKNFSDAFRVRVCVRARMCACVCVSE